MPLLISKSLISSDFLKSLSFLQICALIWVLNLYNFKSNTENLQLENIKKLDMKAFLSDMSGSLEKLSIFFNNKPTSTEISMMTDPSVTQTDAKHQQNSDGKDSKQAESMLILEQFSSEIKKVQHWINHLINELELLKYCQLNNL